MCKCMDLLTTPQPVTNSKKQQRQLKYLDSGWIVNLDTGEGKSKPVLRGLMKGPGGNLTISHAHWTAVRFCPACGAPVELWDQEVIEESINEAHKPLDTASSGGEI